MTFISYAQNNEDIMLWRALKHIDNGFYIDVGAAWPDEHSVTKLFYDQGWRGINIEPNPVHIKRFPKERLGDINLPLAISNKIGEAEMYFISNTGLSSLNKKIAESHNKQGFKTTKCTVNLATLASICKEHCVKKEIHFLKIDIEGYEKQALLGNDWVKFRPWVVVIEATLPMSQAENYSEWEPILLKANYFFAYADGLNRFYVSKEHKELLPAFKYPPNV
ncbi:FkbM family methyltransferase, partial [Methylophilaceae bacterium]|nr:FkbM family methyltransferase [Methylophilaceae bacterium]